MSAKLFTIVVMIFLAVAFGMFLFIDSFNDKLNEATGLAVSETSFPTYLETHPVVSSLPKSASIGIKIGDSSYDIEGRNVYLKDEFSDKDIIVKLPGGYESVIGELGICDAVGKAYNEDKLEIETYANKAILFLKYRKLLKYGGCLK